MRCLLAINARDARRPFVPKDHWLVGTLHESERDMVGFMEAAVVEENRVVEAAEQEAEGDDGEDADADAHGMDVDEEADEGG
jgi:hypothetical protein